MKLQRWEQGEFGAYECSDGDWVKWDDVQANTIPIPDVRVEDEGSYGGSDRWSVYLNRRCMGIHTERESAVSQAEYIRFALNIPQ